jgi:hypothetical protein
MNKFWAFRELLDFMADHAEVVDADMDNYCGDIVITGDDGEHIIKIEVSIKNKEEKKDD